MNKQNQHLPRQPYPEDDEIDLRDLLDVLRSGKWLIAGVTAIAGALGLAYALLAMPIFQADALIHVESERGSFISPEALGLIDDSNVEAEIQLLRSRMVLGRAVDKRDLEVIAEPRRFPVIGGFLARRADSGEPADAMFGLAGYAWGGEQIDVPQFVVPDAYLGEEFRLVAGSSGRFTLRTPDGRNVLEGAVDETASNGDGSIRIFVRELRARPGSEFRVVRRSRQAAIDSLRNRLTVSESGRGSGMLSITLEEPDRSAASATLNAIANAFVRQNVERRSLEAERRIEFLDDQLPEVRRELETAEERFNAFRSENEAFDLTSEGQNILGQVVEIESMLAEAELKRAELRQNYAARHPRIIALNDQVGQLQQTRSELDGRIRQLPESQQELLRLKREVDVGTEIYTALLNQSQELRVVRAGTIGNVRVVDEAVAGFDAIRPRKSLILALSVVLGGMLGTFAVFGRHMFRRTISNAVELEDRHGLSCYAAIPRSDKLERCYKRSDKAGTPRPILVRDLPEEPASESLRSLRTSLHFALMNQQRRVVAFTGPSPGIGKTFIATNLGWLLGQAGKRTVLVDADMRRGHLHEYFDQRREPGLSDIIAGRVTWDDAVRKGGEQGLDHVTSGTVPPNPSELLMCERFDRLISDLEQAYDFVVIDTAPVLAATDGVLASARAGAIFMVVRAGENHPAEVDQALKRLERDGVAVSGFVLNALPKASGKAGYGSYHHYQYDYPSQKA